MRSLFFVGILIFSSLVWADPSIGDFVGIFGELRSTVIRVPHYKEKGNVQKAAASIELILLRGVNAVETYNALKGTPEFKAERSRNPDFDPRKELLEIRELSQIRFFLVEGPRGSILTPTITDVPVVEQYKKDFIARGPEYANHELGRANDAVANSYKYSSDKRGSGAAASGTGNGGGRGGNVGAAVVAMTDFSRDFAKQYISYCLGNGVLSLIPNSVSKSNPMAVNQSVNSCYNAIGAAGFLAFMAGNAGTQMLLKNGTSLPPGLKSIAGMGVGLTFSSVASDLLEDFFNGDIKICRSGEDGPQRDESCLKAWKRWMSVNRLGSLSPTVASTLGAFGMTALTGAATVKIFGKEAVSGLKSQIYSFGAREIVILGKPFRMLPGAWVLTIGDFVIFLGWDRVISSPVQKIVNGWNFNSLGMYESETLRDSKAKNSVLLKSLKKQEQDRQWLFENIENLPSAYQEQDLVDCEPLKETSWKPWVWFRKEKKPADQGEDFERCMRRLDPQNILQNQLAFNGERTRVLLEPFRGQQLNWHLFLADYIQVYEATRLFTQELIKTRQAYDQGQVSDDDLAEAFSKDAIRDLIANLVKVPREGEPFSKKLNGLKFSHLADYVIYGLVCGPQVPERSKASSTSPWDPEGELEGVRLSDAEFIRTPFGRALDFIPPQITSSRPKRCEPQIAANGDFVFEGFWKIEDANPIDNLTHFLFRNLDEKILGYQDFAASPDSFLWWDDYVGIYSKKVWRFYEKAYVHIVRENLLPLLLGPEGRSGIGAGLALLYPDSLNSQKGLITHYEETFQKHRELLEAMMEEVSSSPAGLLADWRRLEVLVRELGDQVRQRLKDWENDRLALEEGPELLGRLESFKDVAEKTIEVLSTSIPKKEIKSDYLALVVDPNCTEKTLQYQLFWQRAVDADRQLLYQHMTMDDLSEEDRYAAEGLVLPLKCSDKKEARALLGERQLPEAAVQLVVGMMQEYQNHLKSLVNLTKPLGF